MRIIRTGLLIVLVHVIGGSAFGQVFPVFPSGTMPDGSFYRSTLTIANFASVATSCTARLQQDGGPTETFNLEVNPSQWTIWRPAVNNTYTPAYVVVSCDQQASIQARYAYYSSQSVMLGESNVPASIPVTYAVFAMDRVIDNARVGIALANDSDSPISATVTVYDPSTNVPLVHSITVGPRTTLTQFVDEMTGWNGSSGLITISAPSQFYVMGLRYTGQVFSSLLPLGVSQ